MKRISRRRFLGTLGLSGAGVVGLSGYGFAVEPMWRLEVTRHRVTPTNWPRELKLSIAVIADLHAGGPTMPLERIHGIVENTNFLGGAVLYRITLEGGHRVLVQQPNAGTSRLFVPGNGVTLDWTPADLVVLKD